MTQSKFSRVGKKFIHITASGDTVIRGDGNSVWLELIVINMGVGATISIYNSPTATAEDLVAIIATATSSNSRRTFEYGVRLSKGLTINLSQSGLDITVAYE